MDVRIYWDTPESKKTLLDSLNDDTGKKTFSKLIPLPEKIATSHAPLTDAIMLNASMTDPIKYPADLLQEKLKDPKEVQQLREEFIQWMDVAIDNLAEFGMVSPAKVYRQMWGTTTDIVAYAVNDTHAVLCCGDGTLDPWISELYAIGFKGVVSGIE